MGLWRLRWAAGDGFAHPDAAVRRGRDRHGTPVVEPAAVRDFVAGQRDVVVAHHEDERARERIVTREPCREGRAGVGRVGRAVAAPRRERHRLDEVLQRPSGWTLPKVQFRTI